MFFPVLQLDGAVSVQECKVVKHSSCCHVIINHKKNEGDGHLFIKITKHTKVKLLKATLARLHLPQRSSKHFKSSYKIMAGKNRYDLDVMIKYPRVPNFKILISIDGQYLLILNKIKPNPQGQIKSNNIRSSKK